jgi:hypothetical protein
MNRIVFWTLIVIYFVASFCIAGILLIYNQYFWWLITTGLQLPISYNLGKLIRHYGASSPE